MPTQVITCLWINISKSWEIGDSSPPITTAKAHHLKSDSPQTTKQYLGLFQNHCKTHNLLHKRHLQKINRPEDLTPAICYDLDALDNIWLQGMLKAKWQYRKLHTRPYGLTLETTQTITEIKYWWYTLKQHCTRTTNLHFAVHLACKLLLPPLHPSTAVPKIQQQIVDTKTWLQKLLCDLKEQTKWLEDLAGAQASEHGTDPGKCLQQLQWTEEQWTHAHQIGWTNQTHPQARELSQVTTATKAGNIIQHTTQYNIKTACLEEAKAQFTQANNTPWMTKPL